MLNLKIYLPLVDGSRLEVDSSNGKELIHGLFGDDFGAPAQSLCIEATSAEGLPVRITIPYSDADEAHVIIIT